MSSIFLAEQAANRVLDRRPDCTRQDVELAHKSGLVEWPVDVDGYYPSPTDAYIYLMDIENARDFFSGLRSDLVCWVKVLTAQFGLTEVEAIKLLGQCWPAGAEKPLETVSFCEGCGGDESECQCDQPGEYQESDVDYLMAVYSSTY